MSRGKYRIAFFYALLFLMILAACNPKPEPVEDVKPEKPDTLIQNREKLLEKSPALSQANLLMQGLERISHYLGADLSDQEYSTIYYDAKEQYYSYIDFLQLMLTKGYAILPKYGSSQEIIDQINLGNPVLAQFPLSGGMSTEGIFYGYNDQYFFYYPLSSLKEKKIPIHRVEAFATKELKLFVYDKEIQELDSDYYFLLYTQDIYRKDDRELFKKAVERIEREGDWFEKDNSFVRFYAIYYTFYDPQPDKVEPILSDIESPFLYPEINFMLQIIRGDKEKAAEALASMNLAQQMNLYRDETLYQIGLLSIENGNLGMASQALQSLNERNPDYPGLKEAMAKLDQ